ncbi:MAG: FxsA family protein [Pseudomonadota bacterium]
MPFLILALFITVPLAEIAVFIAAGDAIGLIPTIITVILTAILGTYLLQRQGLSTMAKTQQEMNAGRIPMEQIADGIYLLMAGALLLTPGFITDGVGFLLFVPPFRRWLGRTLFRRMMTNADIHVASSRNHTRADADPHPTNGPRSTTREQSGPIIDGDFEHVEPRDAENGTKARNAGHTSANKNSPWRAAPER